MAVGASLVCMVPIDKAPRFRSRNRSLDRVQVPQLSNKNDIRILSQRVLGAESEAVHVGTNLALIHQAPPLRVNKFDRVLNTDDVDGTPSGYRLSHARQCCAFAFTARASHKHQAGALRTPLIHHGRVSNVLRGGISAGICRKFASIAPDT